MFKILYRYLAKNLLLNFLIVLSIMYSIIFVIDLMEFSKRFSELINSPMMAFRYTTLHTLSHLTSFMGFIVLLSGVITYFRLNIKNELVIIRFCGFSTFRIIVVTFTILGLIGLFYLLVITPISSYAVRKYDNFKVRALKEERSFVISDSGLWFKDISDDNVLKIVNVGRVEPQSNTVHNIEVFSYDTANRLLVNMRSKMARIEQGYWRLYNVDMMDSNLESNYHDIFTIPLNISIKELNSSLKDPKTIPFWKFEKVIKLAQESGFSTKVYEAYYYNLLIIPIIFGAMSIFGAVFMFSVGRRIELWKRFLIAAMCGLGIYFINNVFHTFILPSSLPILFAVLIPYIVLILVTIYLAVLSEERLI